MAEEQSTPSLEERIRALIGEEPSPRLRELLDGLEPFDVADELYHFDVAEQQMLLGYMAPEMAAEVVTHLDEPALEALFEQMPQERLAAYVDLMEPDDAADLIDLMQPEMAQGVLERLRPELRAEVNLLLTYGPETAGGIMDPDVVQVRASQSVASALVDVRRYVNRVKLDDFFVIFVVNDARQLVGVVPNWKMLLAKDEQRIEEIMEPDPISVEAHLDQEEVAHLVMDHDVVTLPVVDSHHRLIGRITVDDVVDVIQEEHEEDLGHLAGTGSEAVREPSLFQTLRTRAPWLFVAFFGEFISAMIMHAREDFLVLVPQLAFFVPVIMAMGGNTGIQSSSLVIRGLATGEVRLSHFWRRLSRELSVSVCIGALFAAILIGGGALLTGNHTLGLAVGLAIMASITFASLVGIIIPMVLKRLNQDPALATGPFLTTMNDVMGILIYLAVAHAIMF